jgi:hypothetical protein
VAKTASPVSKLSRRIGVVGKPSLTITLATALSSQTIDDARLVEIVRRHLHFDPVAHSETNESFTHLARYVSEDKVPVFKLHTKHGSRQNTNNFSFSNNLAFGRHNI